MPFKLTDIYSTADICLLASGQTLEELFVDSAAGLIEIIVDRDSLGDKRKIGCRVEGKDLEELYYNWLAELIYIKDAELFLPRTIVIDRLTETGPTLTATLYGETIDQSRHRLKVDVKAVTYYKFKIEKIDNLWRGEVVFDI